MDVSALTLDSTVPFFGRVTVDLSSTDHTFVDAVSGLAAPVRGIRCHGSGNLKVQYFDGSEDTIPVVCPASDHVEVLRGHVITKVFKTGTTISAAITGLK